MDTNEMLSAVLHGVTRTVKVPAIRYKKDANGKNIPNPNYVAGKNEKYLVDIKRDFMVTFDFEGMTVNKLLDTLVGETSPRVREQNQLRDDMTADTPVAQRVLISDLLAEKREKSPESVANKFANSSKDAQLIGLKAMLANATDASVRTALQATINALSK